MINAVSPGWLGAAARHVSRRIFRGAGPDIVIPGRSEGRGCCWRSHRSLAHPREGGCANLRLRRTAVRPDRVAATSAGSIKRVNWSGTWRTRIQHCGSVRCAAKPFSGGYSPRTLTIGRTAGSTTLTMERHTVSGPNSVPLIASSRAFISALRFSVKPGPCFAFHGSVRKAGAKSNIALLGAHDLDQLRHHCHRDGGAAVAGRTEIPCR